MGPFISPRIWEGGNCFGQLWGHCARVCVWAGGGGALAAKKTYRAGTEHNDPILSSYDQKHYACNFKHQLFAHGSLLARHYDSPSKAVPPGVQTPFCATSQCSMESGHATASLRRTGIPVPYSIAVRNWASGSRVEVAAHNGGANN